MTPSNVIRWNNMIKPSECNVIAKPTDLLTTIDGVTFLIQTENEANNVIFLRESRGSKTLRKVLLEFRRFCLKHKIQYIRVEGNHRRYWFLKTGEKTLKGYEVRYNLEESQTLQRNVFYIKLGEIDD